MRYFRLSILVLVSLLAFSCGNSNRFDRTQTPGQSATTEPVTLVDIPLSVSFQMAGATAREEVVRSQSFDELTRLKVSFFTPSGDLVADPYLVEIPRPVPEPWLIDVPDIPAEQELLMRLEGLDGEGNVVYDLERVERFISPLEPRTAGMTPTESTVSATFYLVPYIVLESPLAQGIVENVLESLQEFDVTLVDDEYLCLSPSALVGWRAELGDQSYTVGVDGRVRFSEPTVTTGRLVHPASPDITVDFSISEFSRGQIARTAFVVRFPFAGPCGMDDETRNDPTCTGVLSLPDDLRAATIIAQRARRASLTTANACNHLVPEPTEDRILARGRYPDPASEIGGGEAFQSCHNDCEDFNGVFEDPPQAYFGSTCFRYVDLGCCPNENTLADSEAFLAIPESALRNLTSRLATYVWDTPTIEVVDPTVSIDSDTSCLDNHKGRVCQQMFVGDVSLDFTASRKAPIVKPDDPEPVIIVSPGEDVEFVLHNNGCFGNTDITAPLKQIDGDLVRTYKETTLSSATDSGDPNVRKLRLSTDPLLGGVPTAGDFNDVPRPFNKFVDPAATSFLSTPVSQIIHYEIDFDVANRQGSCSRYRYYPDISMEYRTADDAKTGQRDRFIFTVDECQVAVTFLVLGGSGTPGGDPDDVIDVSPRSLSTVHRIGTSPCPQSVGELLLSRATGQDTVVGVQAQPPLRVDNPFHELFQNRTESRVRIIYDCPDPPQAVQQDVIVLGQRQDGRQEEIRIPVRVDLENN